jgi:hypothetical protein
LRVFAIGQFGWGARRCGRVEQSPDAAGEVAFEAADRFQSGLALGVFAVEVDAGFGVGAGAGERDDVQGTVELAVTVPQPGWASSCEACASISVSSSARRSRSSRPISVIRRSSARATRSCGLGVSRASWRESQAQIPGPFERGLPDLRFDLGGDRDQVPPQSVDHPGPFADELVAVVAEDPDVQCRQSSIAHTRSGSRPAANRSASRDPASLAGICSCPRAFPVSPSTATNMWLRL